MKNTKTGQGKLRDRCIYCIEVVAVHSSYENQNLMRSLMGYISCEGLFMSLVALPMISPSPVMFTVCWTVKLHDELACGQSSLIQHARCFFNDLPFTHQCSLYYEADEVACGQSWLVQHSCCSSNDLTFPCNV